MSKIRIIIFGSKGMLGSELVKVFSEERHDAYEVLAPTIREADITNYSSVHNYFEKVSPAWLINAAAYTNVDEAENESERAFAINRDGVNNLANVAYIEHTPLVHYSTDYVFPGDNQDGYMEDAVPGPAVNVYGESKLAGEELLSKVNPQRYLIRTAWLYGKNGPNFVEKMLELGKAHDELKVINDQFGNPTYAHDLAQATRTLLDREKSYEPGTYHLVNSGTATWYDFAQEIFTFSRIKVDLTPIPTKEYPTPAKRPQYSMLQNTRGPEMRPWSEALREYLRIR
jgi:dTDP-4-dehydrorhamnose reductase